MDQKKIRRIAKGRNADLRDLYLHNISEFSPEHFVFVDESGCDRRAGSRRLHLSAYKEMISYAGVAFYARFSGSQWVSSDA